MDYKKLQEALKPYKEKGLCNVRLNATKPELEAELERLTVTSHQSSVTSEESLLTQNAIATCPTCQDKPVYRCPKCNSRGLIEDPEAAPMATTYECPRCDGRGFVTEVENPQWLFQSICPDCRREEFSGHSSDPSSPDSEVNSPDSDPLNKPFPCWLNSKQTAQAKALEELEFYYIGTVDDWEEPWPELLLGRYKDWEFHTAYLSPGSLEAHCEGAIFNAYIDEEASKEEYKDLIKKAKAVLKSIDKNWDKQFGTQLDIFTALNQANAPPQVA